MLVLPTLDPLPIRFNITLLCDADIVIGLNWMTEHGSIIDFKHCFATVESVRLSAPIREVLRAPSSNLRNPCTGSNTIPLGTRRSPTTIQVIPVTPEIRSVSLDEPDVASIRSVLRAALHEIPVSTEDQLPQPTLSREEYAELVTAEPQFEEPKIFDQAEHDAETAELLKQVPEYLHDYLDIFRQRQGTSSLPPTRQHDMRLDLCADLPIISPKLYQVTEEQRQVLLKTLERELEAGRIVPSKAAYGSPTFFVPKKDGRWRMVVDYRQVNKATIVNSYPLPLISQIITDLRSAQWFSKFDLPGAYQLLRMMKEHAPRTAFRTQYGQFESNVVRDGLRNAPSYFQNWLNDIFRSVLGRGVIIYIDDILCYAKTLEELRNITKEVFDIVRANSLYLKASKCEFEMRSITFLGYVISNHGVETDPTKVEAVRSFPKPTNLSESRSFIGLTSYYRRFVKGFSNIAGPITDLTKKNIPFIWGEAQDKAFEELKRCLCTAPVIAHFDPSRETLIQTNASHFGWGFVISQINADNQEEHPIARSRNQLYDNRKRVHGHSRSF